MAQYYKELKELRLSKEISLEELLEIYPKMLDGKTSGRYVINLKK